jgi:zinc-ribbon domain
MPVSLHDRNVAEDRIIFKRVEHRRMLRSRPPSGGLAPVSNAPKTSSVAKPRLLAAQHRASTKEFAFAIPALDHGTHQRIDVAGGFVRGRDHAARLVWASETEKGRNWAERRVTAVVTKRRNLPGELGRRCSHCGFEIRPTANFCGGCGRSRAFGTATDQNALTFLQSKVPSGPADALAQGIAMVHQHFSLVPATALEAFTHDLQARLATNSHLPSMASDMFNATIEFTVEPAE